MEQTLKPTQLQTVGQISEINLILALTVASNLQKADNSFFDLAADYQEFRLRLKANIFNFEEVFTDPPGIKKDQNNHYLVFG